MSKIFKVSFGQAAGILIYILLVAIIFWKGNEWFGKADNYLGPVLVLTLFSVSALICSLITFTYPLWLFWEKKQTKQAIKLVIYTALWLIFFLAIIFIVLLVT
jgi:hypothetical protein